MNEATNIVSVRMLKDGTFDVSINGREIADVVSVRYTDHPAIRGETLDSPDTSDGPDIGEYWKYVTLSLRVAQYNIIPVAPDADQVTREYRGKLIAAHEEGQCVMCRLLPLTDYDSVGKWMQADPTRDGWFWNTREYKLLA